MKTLLYIDLLHKYALDIPSWMPEKIRNYLGPIEEVKKDPRLVNFREPLNEKEKKEIVNESTKEFSLNMKYNLQLMRNMLDTISESIKFVNSPEEKKVSNKIDLYYTLIENFLNATDDNFNENKIIINKNIFKITKLYNNIHNAIFSIFDSALKLSPYLEHQKTRFKWLVDNISELEKIPGKSVWDNRLDTNTEYSVVFSTDYKDILTMSSRSEWTSCQDVRPDSIKDEQKNLRDALIGSVIEPSVGIMYITNNKDYKGIGERMLFRSAVWIVTNRKTGEDALSIQQIYPMSSQDITKIFKEKLQKHINIKVLSYNENYDDYETNFSLEVPTPYDDKSFTNNAKGSKSIVIKILNDFEKLIPNIVNKSIIDNIANDIIKIVFTNETPSGKIITSIVKRTFDMSDEDTIEYIRRQIIFVCTITAEITKKLLIKQIQYAKENVSNDVNIVEFINKTLMSTTYSPSPEFSKSLLEMYINSIRSEQDLEQIRSMVNLRYIPVVPNIKEFIVVKTVYYFLTNFKFV